MMAGFKIDAVVIDELVGDEMISFECDPVLFIVDITDNGGLLFLEIV